MGKPLNTVEEIIRLVRAAAPGLDEGQLERIARRLYTDMGGEQRYFPKAPTLGKAWRLGDVIAAGVPFAQAYQHAGMSRASAYRANGRRRRWMR